MRSKSVILSAVVVLALVLTDAGPIRAQGSGAPQSEVDSIIMTVGTAMGMFRAVILEEALMTIQYWGHGTMYEGATPVEVKNYSGSIAYDFPGMRVDFTRSGGAAPNRRIEVVSGEFAWNETEEGGGLDPTFGQAMPAMETANERLLRLWMTPLGVVKALIAAKASAKVTNEGGITAITFSLTGPARISRATNVVVGALKGAPVTLTLGADRRPERVEVRFGGKVYEATYTDYGDLNGEDYLADVYWPRRIVQKVDGQTTWDVTITKTNTYNPYVIVSVPESVQKAAKR